jgi:hypothetical protein
VNHNYDGQITAQRGFNVGPIQISTCPRKVTRFSPDRESVDIMNIACSGGILNIHVDNLEFYNVLVVET